MQVDFVKAQAAEVDALALSFQQEIDRAADEAEAELLAYYDERLAVVDGIIDTDSESLAAIAQLPILFDKAITASGAYAAAAAFVAAVAASGVESAKAAYSLMAKEGDGLPATAPDLSGYADALEKAGVLLQEMLEQHIDAAKDVLTRFALRVLGGGLSKRDFDAQIAAAFVKLRKLGDLPIEMTMLVFRLCLQILFSSLDDADLVALFEYVGVRDHKNRAFCAHLLDVGGQYTMRQIEAMDNGQGLPVFENCGGYGCRHWWWAARAVRRRDL